MVYFKCGRMLVCTIQHTTSEHERQFMCLKASALYFYVIRMSNYIIKEYCSKALT